MSSKTSSNRNRYWKSSSFFFFRKSFRVVSAKWIVFMKFFCNEIRYLKDKFLWLVIVSVKRFSRRSFDVRFSSLGSVILYDILVNQTPATKEEAMINEKGKEKKRSIFDFWLRCRTKSTEKNVKENLCVSGTGQISIQYEKLNFPVAYCFALGSPIAMFLTVRGVRSLAVDYELPTCRGLLNIFHPVKQNAKEKFLSFLSTTTFSFSLLLLSVRSRRLSSRTFDRSEMDVFTSFVTASQRSKTSSSRIDRWTFSSDRSKTKNGRYIQNDDDFD